MVDGAALLGVYRGIRREMSTQKSLGTRDCRCFGVGAPSSESGCSVRLHDTLNADESSFNSDIVKCSDLDDVRGSNFIGSLKSCMFGKRQQHHEKATIGEHKDDSSQIER